MANRLVKTTKFRAKLLASLLLAFSREEQRGGRMPADARKISKVLDVIEAVVGAEDLTFEEAEAAKAVAVELSFTPEQWETSKKKFAETPWGTHTAQKELLGVQDDLDAAQEILEQVPEGK